MSTTKTEPSSRLDRPPMPDPPPGFDITINAELLHDFDTYSTGNLCMTMDTMSVTSEGKVVGTVSYALGGAVMIKIGSRAYRVGFKDLFEAVYNAEQEQL